MAGTATDIWERIRPKTLIEWLVVFAIIAVLIALLLPGPQWISDGDITIPVHVRVFDPSSGKPIPNAQVGILRYRTIFSSSDIEPLEENLAHVTKTPTNDAGSVSINQMFYTNASDRNPVTRAHLGGVWIIVEADGYDRAFVPVRNESLPTAELRKRGEILVPVALLRAK
jgi:hypothetical protein